MVQSAHRTAGDPGNEDVAGGPRARILDAAERLVGARGYSAASISMIVRESGLPASSIYWHFGSKEDLLAAVVERGAARWHAAQARWSQYDGDLAAFLEGTGAAVAEHPQFLRLLMMLNLDGQGGQKRARQSVRKVWRSAEGGLERVMALYFGLGDGRRDKALAGRLARFTLAMIDGAFLDSQIDPDGTEMKALFADLAVALEALATAHGVRSRTARPASA
jgi:AcrR family transcriptional regulator